MSDSREGMLAALRGLLDVPCSCCLATNSIKLSFHDHPDPGGRAYLWIDPPWRLSAGGVVVTGSTDWPPWDGVTDREVNGPLWDAWRDLFGPLGGAKAVEVRVGEEFPDLAIRFGTGHRIETFGDTASDSYPWWYSRDRITGEVFEAGAFGIRRVPGEPAV